jgi:hypothetical protein
MKQELIMKQAASKASCFRVVSCLAYSSNLKMEAKYSSETSVDFQRTTQPYITENIILYNHRSESLKFYIGLQIIRIVEDGVYETVLSVPGSGFSEHVNMQLITQPDIFILSPNSDTMQWKTMQAKG